MKLSYITIENYRSITTVHKVQPSNLTVFVGKNNEGKSNIIKAIALGMKILEYIGQSGRKTTFYSSEYQWNRDFPISLQGSNKLKNKSTKIRFDFSLQNDEISELFDITGSNINGELSIFIELGENRRLSVTVPKKGKNAKSLSNKIVEISAFICNHFEIQYIPAIRSEKDAIVVMSELLDLKLRNIDDQVYKDYLEYIEKKQDEIIEELSKKLAKDLKTFLPEINRVKLEFSPFRYRNRNFRGSLNVIIDDGIPTDLSYKGDGVKSLTTIALLSSTSNSKDRLVIVDEPENNLHSGAVRYISNVLFELSQTCQVIVSTHDPIFVNRYNISSNWIVDSHKAVPARKIDEIRNTLGIMCSDNLMYSDYVIVVEGPTDRDFLYKIFKEDDKIKKALNSKTISIRNIGGVNNLCAEVYALQRYCCNYLIILDSDSAGRNASKDIKTKFSVPENRFRFFMKSNPRLECELEDLIIPELYKDILMDYGFNIDNKIFKDQSKKFSKKLSLMASEIGIDYNDVLESEIKKRIQEKLKNIDDDFLTTHGKKLLNSICEKVTRDMENMSLCH